MKYDINIKRVGKWKNEEKERNRVKYSRLNVTHKGRSAKIVRAPEWN